MSMQRNLLRVGVAAVAVAAALLAEGDLSPKGIYRDSTNTAVKNGVSYRVLLERGGQRSQVPVTYAFHSGDRFSLQVKLKDDAYVYVINRTFEGDPERMASKGITIVRDDDHKQKPKPGKDTYTLLYPIGPEAGAKVKKGDFRNIPVHDLLRMDETPGVEKVYVVVSDKPLDLTKLFRDGKLVNAPGSRPGEGQHSSDGRQSDSPGDALDNLDRGLAEWAENSASEAPVSSKGIVREGSDEGDGCTVGNRAKPIMAEISLKHYR
jgi:hypothetical protein